MSRRDRGRSKTHQTLGDPLCVVVGAVVEAGEELDLSRADLGNADLRWRLVLHDHHPAEEVRLKGGGSKVGRVERVEKIRVGSIRVDVDPAGRQALPVERCDVVDHFGIGRVPHQDSVVVRDRNPMHEQRGRLVKPSQVRAVGIARESNERLEPRAPEVGIGSTQPQSHLGGSDHGDPDDALGLRQIDGVEVTRG